MTNEIKIYGGIGIPDEYGRIVTHEDVVNKIDSMPDAEIIKVRIRTPGGLLRTGSAIYDSLVNSGKEVIMIGEEFVGSVGTKIYAAGSQRLSHPSTEFFFHNPEGGVRGNAAVIRDYLSDMEAAQDELKGFYASTYGIDEEILSVILDNALTLTASDAMELGIVTGIIEPKAAYIKQINRMGILQDIQSLVGRKTEEVQALSITLVDGAIVNVDTKENAPQIGANVYGDNNAALENGEYEMADGTFLVVESGSITDIHRKVEETVNVAELVAAEVSKQMAEIKALLEPVAESIDAQNKKLDTAMSAVKEQEDALRLVASTYVPSGRDEFRGNVVNERTVNPMERRMKEIHERTNKNK